MPTSKFDAGDNEARKGKGVPWTRPDILVEVEYRGWTSDGQLRHSSFKGVRDTMAIPWSLSPIPGFEKFSVTVTTLTRPRPRRCQRPVACHQVLPAGAIEREGDPPSRRLASLVAERLAGPPFVKSHEPDPPL
jgi:hypothetical protein